MRELFKGAEMKKTFIVETESDVENFHQWLNKHDKRIMMNVIISLEQIQLGYGTIEEYINQLKEAMNQ